jgi:hypothetical protein
MIIDPLLLSFVMTWDLRSRPELQLGKARRHFAALSTKLIVNASRTADHDQSRWRCDEAV